MLTATQERFIAAAKEVESLKEQLKEKCAEMEKYATEIGAGCYFQDKDLVVYKIDVPKGTFVEYKAIGFVRTKRANEDRGSLSMKEAKDAGFNVG